VMARIWVNGLAWLMAGCLWISLAAQDTSTRTARDASDLLTELLSPETPDSRWSATEKSFEALPPSIALPVLFREIAKGIPGGYSYAAYNCFDPFQDRKLGGWGRFCVANSLWCKQLACPMKRKEVGKVLLELWANPISDYGQMVLIDGLCSNPDAESKIAVLFRDSRSNARLRTQAAICLLHQDEPKYHAEVVAFAEKAPIRFAPPGLHSYPLQLKRVLFDELTSPTHHKSGVDAAVVRLGFSLMLGEGAPAEQYGDKFSNYGQFLYADRMNAYLGAAFEPDRRPQIYTGSEGNERFWHDTNINALAWWSRHKEEYR